MKKFPIGITGNLHTGKDTLADLMIKFRPGTFYKYSFAKPMKDIAVKIFGFTEAQMYEPDKKQEVDPFWDITPRKFLQLMGTDMFRDTFRDDVWIKMAEKSMMEHPDIHMMVPDVRFDNEAEFIKDQGGFLIKIVRKTDKSLEKCKKHVSEAGVDEKYIDVVVDNNGTFLDLEKEALDMIHTLEARIKLGDN
jgi:hypothetical protein